MPAKWLTCPCTFGPLPIDHFASGACKGLAGGMHMPLEWVESIVEDRISDAYHAGTRLTTTRCLGCPRESFIADTKDYVFDPAHANSPHWGTAVHEKISKNRSSQYFEVRFGGPGDALPAARLFRGEMGLVGTEGIVVCGKVDKITLGYGAIHDYKLHSETSQRFKGRDNKTDWTTAAQLNIYRHSLEDVGAAPPETIQELVAYHGAMTSKRGPRPWIPEVLPLMSQEQILDVKPGGGTFTVREIIREYQRFFIRQSEGVNLDANLHSIALVGRTMFNQAKCTDYCQPGVKQICDRLEGIETF